MASRLISVVVPVFSEAETLEALAGEIRQVAEQSDLDLQTVFVDDGSRDESWSRIVALANADPSIGGLRFRKNAGKAAALMAGFAAAQGEIVFTMDADLQDPPAEMPRFIEKIDAGFDLVSGWKRRRHDPWHKVYPSKVFNWMIRLLTRVPLHDHACGFKCFRRDLVGQLRLYGELHRFLGVLAAAKGYRVTEISTLHRPRTRGVGKYGFTRFFKGFLDLLTVWFLARYRWRPQHVIGVAGLLTILLNLVLAVIAWLDSSILTALLAPVLIVWSGFTLIAIGLVAELIVADRPIDDLYVISERVGWCCERTGHERRP